MFSSSSNVESSIMRSFRIIFDRCLIDRVTYAADFATKSRNAMVAFIAMSAVLAKAEGAPGLLVKLCGSYLTALGKKQRVITMAPPHSLLITQLNLDRCRQVRLLWCFSPSLPVWVGVRVHTTTRGIREIIISVRQQLENPPAPTQHITYHKSNATHHLSSDPPNRPPSQVSVEWYLQPSENANDIQRREPNHAAQRPRRRRPFRRHERFRQRRRGDEDHEASGTARAESHLGSRIA